MAVNSTAYAVQLTFNPWKLVYKNPVCTSQGTESIFDIITDNVMPFGETLILTHRYIVSTNVEFVNVTAVAHRVQ